MIYRVDWNNSKAVIGCGMILTLLGVVIISPVVAWLINVIGWLLMVFGLLGVTVGVGSWALGTRRRD